ncbi:helix-turn-helix transcriptional regulator [Paenibacillus sp. ISL-20]|uniref:helix-turn-helix domain-containing protein n=1 Tax=Paenibacillus sp. ISL-20 TaxID=2819163 RepID=UPI001BEB7431|nr:helix-turn-helix transcriptional regulator [Paenibacillus sp. ISL-20]MBT2766019.1 helix-turn-helix transcriptional regulator [Paenibacillus sp. ISL-20]
MIKINTYVGERIRSIRKARNLTQADLGEQVDLPQPYVGGIERGERNISLDTLQKLLEALHITPAELFREYDNLHKEETTEIIDRINQLLTSRSLDEVKIVETFIKDILSTIDRLKDAK